MTCWMIQHAALITGHDLSIISINLLLLVYCESVNLIGYITVFYLLIVNSYASVHIVHHV